MNFFVRLFWVIFYICIVAYQLSDEGKEQLKVDYKTSFVFISLTLIFALSHEFVSFPGCKEARNLFHAQPDHSWPIVSMKKKMN